MSEILTINVIQKISKQKIWTIRENDCYYLIKKTAYAYDFGLIGIREKNGSIWKYCYPSENTGIVVTYQNQGNHNTITINNHLKNEIVSPEDIDAILIYFERESQALLAVSTSVTFEQTGIFINSVYKDDIPSLREEAMTFAYLIDHTKGILRLFDNNPFLHERERSIYE